MDGFPKTLGWGKEENQEGNGEQVEGKNGLKGERGSSGLNGREEGKGNGSDH